MSFNDLMYRRRLSPAVKVFSVWFFGGGVVLNGCFVLFYINGFFLMFKFWLFFFFFVSVW